MKKLTNLTPKSLKRTENQNGKIIKISIFCGLKSSINQYKINLLDLKNQMYKCADK